MSEQEPRIVAILLAIEERLTALQWEATNPEGRVQQSQHDVLRIYGDTAQLREVFSLMRDQQMAAADALNILVGRVVEMDRRQTMYHREELDLLNALARGVGEQEIASLASDAKARLDAAEQERLAEIALSADAAKELLRKARLDARSLISRALNQAEAELTEATEVARGIVTAAAETAHEKLTEEAS